MNEAELIFRNGTVRTVDGAPSDALAVGGGRILAIGDADVRPLLGPRTEVVDLGSGALLPGFQDAHAHPVLGGLHRMECDLSAWHSRRDYLREIHAYAASHPELEWITGSGWYGDVFEGGFPDRETLDRVVGSRPAVLRSHDAHGVWANSAALHRAGITAASPDPEGGRILRDTEGEPTGMLVESAAELVTRLLPEPGEQTLRKAIRNAQRYLHGLGITAWQDAAVGSALGLPDIGPAYAALAANGELTAKVTGALWWDRERGLEQVPELVERRRRLAGPGFTPSAVKIMQDGVCENLTAAVLEDYHGVPGERGMSFLDPERLAALVDALTGAGFDLHFHAVGDRAVRECLDAVQKAGRDGDFRHQIAHIDLIAEREVARMRELGVLANLQPLWARQDPVLVETKLPYLTESQRARHFAFGALERAGVGLAMGSDWPVSDPAPLWGIHVAVNRTAPPGDPHAADPRSRTAPLLAGEAIPAERAVSAYTAGSARANRLGDRTGRLAPGLAADLVVLDADPVTVAPEEIGAIGVGMTFADGRLVHERG